MKKMTYLASAIAFSAVLALGGCCFIPDKEETLDLSKMNLVWADEFDGGALDTDYWTKEIWGPGKVNNEVQSYVDSSDNLKVGPECESDSEISSTDDGTLKIIAKSTNGTSWTSSRIITAQKVSARYGYIEARLKMPRAYDANGEEIDNTGVWPAFWMMPEDVYDEEGNSTGGGVYGGWPRSGEIDIMEYSPGTTSQKTYGTLHHSASKSNASQDTYPSLGGTTFDNPYEWHTYGVMWTSGTLEAYYDGVSLGTVYSNPGNNWALYPFDQDFYIILNLAMGGNLGGTINGNMREAVYEIDYVRIYQDPSDSEQKITIQ